MEIFLVIADFENVFNVHVSNIKRYNMKRDTEMHIRLI